MNSIRHRNDVPPLTNEQIRDLAAAVRTDFDGNLSRTAFAENLAMLLEDVPGYESGEVPPSLIELAWTEYGNHRFES